MLKKHLDIIKKGKDNKRFDNSPPKGSNMKMGRDCPKSQLLEAERQHKIDTVRPVVAMACRSALQWSVLFASSPLSMHDFVERR